MELTVKPTKTNAFPVNGLVIRGTSLQHWLSVIQELKMPLQTVQIYPLPGNTPNSIWGCFVLGNLFPETFRHTQTEGCQQVHERLYIPEYAKLVPLPDTDELQMLTEQHMLFFHPETGWVELTDAIDILSHVIVPKRIPERITKPEKRTFIPNRILSFQIAPTSPEDVLKNMEKAIVPEKKSLSEKPLSVMEKVRLRIYRNAFGSKNDSQGKKTFKGIENSRLFKFMSFFKRDKVSYANEIEQDLEELERRNQKAIDRLMEMLRNNPEEALKYAIPLDDSGASRGGTPAELSLQRHWTVFSLFGNFSSGGSGQGAAIISSDSFQSLQEQYLKTAEQLLREKSYEKAAFIYLKLLKQPLKAAEILMEGGFYEEAASIYLSVIPVATEKAAVCYEKGKMLNEAIRLRLELDHFEHAGDLYLQTGNRQEAMNCYRLERDKLKDQRRFKEAAVICLHKMKQVSEAQALFYAGWEANVTPVECYTEYLALLPEEEIVPSLRYEFDLLTNAGSAKSTYLMDVVKQRYGMIPEQNGELRTLAYEMVSKMAQTRPEFVTHLKVFNTENTEFTKETLRYMANRRKRKK